MRLQDIMSSITHFFCKSIVSGTSMLIFKHFWTFKLGSPNSAKRKAANIPSQTQRCIYFIVMLLRPTLQQTVNLRASHEYWDTGAILQYRKTYLNACLTNTPTISHLPAASPFWIDLRKIQQVTYTKRAWPKERTGSNTHMSTGRNRTSVQVWMCIVCVHDRGAHDW